MNGTLFLSREGRMTRLPRPNTLEREGGLKRRKEKECGRYQGRWESAYVFNHHMTIERPLGGWMLIFISSSSSSFSPIFTFTFTFSIVVLVLPPSLDPPQPLLGRANPSSQLRNHRGAKGHVGYEMAVHDVDVDPIATRINQVTADRAESREVSV